MNSYSLAGLASPALTGTPTAPTAASGTNTTQIATTAFVTNAVSGKANTASPTLTGTPKAPTAAAGTNTTQIATTAFVQTALSSVDVDLPLPASTTKAYVIGTTNTSDPKAGMVRNASVYTEGSVLYGAAWNDYAEYRDQKEEVKPGYCVASTNDGKVYKTTEKYQACDGIVSDTFGFAIGETEKCKTPLAVAGRVLAYFDGNIEDYQAGDTVCAGPEGRVMKMTREEIKEYPDRILGHVSEIPNYDTWGENNVEVNDRIWIKIK